MDADNTAPDASQLGEPLDSRLSETAGELDGLSRCSRSSFGTREADAPSLGRAMAEQKDHLEFRLIDRIGEFAAYLPAIKSEMARCEENLRILRERVEQLNLPESREGLQDGIRAQEAQLQRASRQWPEVLDMIAKIATDLQWSHGLPARLPAAPMRPPTAPSWGPPPPAGDGEIDSLMSMGPLDDR